MMANKIHTASNHSSSNKLKVMKRQQKKFFAFITTSMMFSAIVEQTLAQIKGNKRNFQLLIRLKSK